jgi:hypothetical protein
LTTLIQVVALYPEFEMFRRDEYWPLTAFVHKILRSSSDMYRRRTNPDPKPKTKKKKETVVQAKPVKQGKQGGPGQAELADQEDMEVDPTSNAGLPSGVDLPSGAANMSGVIEDDAMETMIQNLSKIVVNPDTLPTDPDQGKYSQIIRIRVY